MWNSPVQACNNLFCNCYEVFQAVEIRPVTSGEIMPFERLRWAVWLMLWLSIRQLLALQLALRISCWCSQRKVDIQHCITYPYSFWECSREPPSNTYCMSHNNSSSGTAQLRRLKNTLILVVYSLLLEDLTAQILMAVVWIVRTWRSLKYLPNPCLKLSRGLEKAHEDQLQLSLPRQWDTVNDVVNAGLDFLNI